MTEVKLTFFKANSEGVNTVNHVITLTNASVVSVHDHPVSGLMDSTTDKFQLEDVAFTFQKITITDNVKDISVVADWLQNVD